MSDVWIIGANGQLGFALAQIYGERARAFTREHLDLDDVASIRPALAALPQPKIVFNATAYNKVDQAETDREACARLNTEVPRELASFARDAGASFLHYSTDFVYSGEGDDPWREDDVAAPINFYGESKLAGEQAVLEAHPLARVFRTSWVYSHRRTNFPLAIIKKAHENPRVTVVTDQCGSPTYAPNLAAASAKIAEVAPTAETAGIFNLSDAGYVSRYDFAREVIAMASRHEFELIGTQFDKTRTERVPTPAQRPLNAKMSLDKIQTTFQLECPLWPEGLRACIRKIYECD